VQSFLRSPSVSAGQFQHSALVVGHPGHELKVFGWVSEYKPRVYVITDGSGRSGIARISSTTALVARVGARRGEIFGAVPDADIYRAILQQDIPRFLTLVDELASSFLRYGIDCVAGDGEEGFNPTHDLCRVVVNAAILLAQRTSGRKITNLEFSLTEWEEACPEPQHDERCLHWTLDDRLLSAKIAAAQQYVELKDDVNRAIAQRREEYFRNECLRPVLDPTPHLDTSKKPFYETWGERQVLRGEYESVIRLEQHILPLANAIFNHAMEASEPVGARPE
jgi:hypothetical protein